MVKSELETTARAQRFELADDNAMKPYMGYWNLAFGYINAKKKISEMPW